MSAMARLRGALPASVGLPLAGLCLAVGLGWFAAGSLRTLHALDQQVFLVAADAARTRLAEYWIASGRKGTPHLPASLAELGSAALPADPWTGQIDWGPVHDASGAIVGLYSRSRHPVEDADALARLAEPRPGLTPVQREALGVSGWMFRFDPGPPAAAPVPSFVAHAAALLAGDPPLAALLSGVSSLAVPTGRPLVAVRPPPLPAMTAPAAAAPTGAAALAPAAAAASVAAASAVVASPDAARLGRPTRPLPPPGGMVTMQPAPAPLPGQPAPAPAEVPDAEDVLSEDPVTRDCQLSVGMGISAICSSEKVASALDHGAAYNACVSDYDQRMDTCQSEAAHH